MLAKIKGKLEYTKDNYVVVDVNGLGYKIFVTIYTLGKIVGQENVELFLHTHVKEDAIELYGFLTMEELEMFELLISISGVGPKSGLGILTVAVPKTIKTAILNEDASILTRVSGIGKKTAERIILELKNKIADLPAGDKEEAVSDMDAIEALTGMGYSASEARDALKMVSKEVKDMGKRIGMALQNLGKK
jgi:holliday junction DNA helicase RuvA